MKTQKLTMILAAAILINAVTGQAAKEPSEPAISNTRTASCLVKVTCDPAILPLSFETIEYLLHSSGVAGGAAAEYGLPRDESRVLFSIEPLSSGTGPLEPKPSLVIPRRPDLDNFGPEEPRPAGRPPARRRRPTRPAGKSDELEFEMYSERPGKVMVPKKSEVAGPRRGARRTPATGKIARRPQWQSSDAPLPPPSVVERMLLFRLQVELPTDVKPIAEEFMNALINNLRLILTEAFDAYRDELQDQLHQANFARDRAQDELANVARSNETEADLATRKQLDEIVDLSALSPEMPFGEAIELLQDSVGPPLKQIVLWRDLQENTDIDRTTPINMDPISAIPLGKALELLLKSVSAGIADLAYEIDRGVITIATVDALPTPEQKFSQSSQMGLPAEVLLDRKNELFREKQGLEMEVARLEAQRSAIEQQIARINHNIAAKVESDPASTEFKPLLEKLEKDREFFEANIDRNTGYRAQLGAVLEKIASLRLQLVERRQNLIRDLGGDQLAAFNKELGGFMIELAVRKAELEVVSKQLEETEAQLRTASAFDPEISRIRLAQEELENAEHSLSELKIRLANLRPPALTVLGGI
ncbi:MAG: hypothetical protein ACYS76_11200 [Planctomycetota bacterium]|jgi:hypothetical protein